METPFQSTDNKNKPCCTPKNKLVCILTGLVLIIIFTTAGFLLGKYYSQSKLIPTSCAAPTPTIVPVTPTSSFDPTANWKPYTFQPIKLSLKIPAELIVHTEEPNPGNDFTADIQNYAFNAPFPKENAYQLYIIWQKIPTITQSEFQSLKDDLDVDTIEDTIVAGYPAIKGQVKGERNRFVIYILKGNTQISLFTSEPTQINKELTDQILSTFKFTQ